MQGDIGAFLEQAPIPVEVSPDIAAILKTVHDVFEIGRMDQAQSMAGLMNKRQIYDGVAKQRIGISRRVGLGQNINFRAAFAVDG